jgi:thiazole/oxazole-forming peptide maturase SagC family component
MEGSIAGKRLRSLPFLVVEGRSGIILKRGPVEILVQGDTALESVLLILTATSDAGQSPEEICRQFPKSAQAQIVELLEEMFARHLLVPADTFTDAGEEESNEDVFYWSANTTSTKVVQVINDLAIAVCGVNRLSREICTSLNRMGVQNLTVIDDPMLRNIEFFTTQGRVIRDSFDVNVEVIDTVQFQRTASDSGLVLATSDFGGQSLLLSWNTFCVQRDIQFMPIYLQDMIGYLGPIVIPGETACLQCLRMRQNAHLANPELARQSEDEMQRGQSIAAIHPSMIPILAETAIFELCHFFGALSEPRPGRLITINLPAGLTESHHVLKIPRCPACSTLVPMSSVQIRKPVPLPK